MQKLTQNSRTDGAMQKVFLMKAVDAIAYNVSKTLDEKHGDKMPLQELIEKAADALLKERGHT